MIPGQIVSNNWIPFFWLNEYRVLLLDATIEAKQWELALHLSSYVAFNNCTKKISNGYRPKNVTKACPLCPKESCHVIISINKLMGCLVHVFENMYFVIWKYMWKYVWVKKYIEIYVMLFKNWKCVFEWVYQTPPSSQQNRTYDDSHHNIFTHFYKKS